MKLDDAECSQISAKQTDEKLKKFQRFDLTLS